ncbi:RNA ligase family protein, partial [Sutterella wadsworthensis]|uniref:ATP-dependent DNA ligase n=1 Tax=Sutterella wadsworthensis TaxID=40545 RepID=UPI0032C0B591
LKKNPNVLGKFFITQKLDGLRFCVIKENGKIKAYSRQGKLQLGYIQILNEFSSEQYPDNTFYDGEVIAKNDNNLNSGDLYRKTMSITGSKSENKTDLDYFIFDIVPLQEFKNGKSKKIYSERRLDLEKLPNNEFIHVVPILYSGYDITKIDEIGENALTNNLEGIMINTDSIDR